MEKMRVMEEQLIKLNKFMGYRKVYKSFTQFGFYVALHIALCLLKLGLWNSQSEEVMLNA